MSHSNDERLSEWLDTAAKHSNISSTTTTTTTTSRSETPQIFTTLVFANNGIRWKTAFSSILRATVMVIVVVVSRMLVTQFSARNAPACADLASKLSGIAALILILDNLTFSKAVRMTCQQSDMILDEYPIPAGVVAKVGTGEAGFAFSGKTARSTRIVDHLAGLKYVSMTGDYASFLLMVTAIVISILLVVNIRSTSLPIQLAEEAVFCGTLLIIMLFVDIVLSLDIFYTAHPLVVRDPKTAGEFFSIKAPVIHAECIRGPPRSTPGTVSIIHSVQTSRNGFVDVLQFH